MKQTLVELIEKDAIKGDIVELSLPATVYTCMSHCGTDHIAGYFEKADDDSVTLHMLEPDGPVFSFPKEDISAYEILKPGQDEPAETIQNKVKPLDLILIETKSDKKMLAYAMAIIEEEIRLFYSEKGAYGLEAQSELIDLPLKDIKAYQVLRKWVPDYNDEIDCFMVSQMQSFGEPVDLPDDWPKDEEDFTEGAPENFTSEDFEGDFEGIDDYEDDE